MGLRRPLLSQTRLAPPGSFDFLEIAPENWIGVGGQRRAAFDELAERCPVVLHGLSLNLGGTAPLNVGLVHRVGEFMNRYNCPLYSEHLTSCGDHGQLYDLMPIPFTEAAVENVADRIRQVQDVLGRRIAIENASYYFAPCPEMDELSFLQAVLQEADCDLLLDVNNVLVNSINHGYTPRDFLRGLPGERIAYFHIAGHFKKTEQLRIDSHGAAVPEAVWELLGETYRLVGPRATLLERDNNFPPFEDLLAEVARIRQLQDGCRTG